MPQISTFFGIIVRMHFGDHAPPHFPAEQQGERATFDFDGTLLRGNITSGTVRRLIEQWASQHRQELELNWRKHRTGSSTLPDRSFGLGR
jgi:hypothetical protein